MDFQFLAIWAAQGSKGKNPIRNYEQLLSSIFWCFHGQKNSRLFKRLVVSFGPMKTWKNRAQKLLIIHNWIFPLTALSCPYGQKLKIHIENWSEAPSVLSTLYLLPIMDYCFVLRLPCRLIHLWTFSSAVPLLGTVIYLGHKSIWFENEGQT